VDQAVKVWVKTHMAYGEDFPFLGVDWFRIHFVENNGMAFGLQFGGANGKLALSLFRLTAVVVLIYYLRMLWKSDAAFGLICSFSLILTGALGNIIDSAFYGLLFSESSIHGGVAEFLPAGGGYARLFHGKVVDMIYLPVWSGILPSWIPFAGGQYAQFFKPVFNIADVAITAGVIQVLFFQTLSIPKRKTATEEEKSQQPMPTQDEPPDSEEWQSGSSEEEERESEGSA
jgi:signal peptidase II